jgi:hypothetical protein
MWRWGFFGSISSNYRGGAFVEGWGWFVYLGDVFGDVYGDVFGGG